jgi:DNA-binding NarL/FixJ family response regulator
MFTVSAAPSRDQPPHRPRRSPSPGHSLLPRIAWDQLREALRLSQREIQVVRGVFDDWKEEQIAHELGLSPHTVNTYLQRLYKKLHVSSRAQLVVRVMADYLMLLNEGGETNGLSSEHLTDENGLEQTPLGTA